MSAEESSLQIDAPRRETPSTAWSTGAGFAGTWEYAVASGRVHCGDEIAEVLGLPAAPADSALAEFLAYIDPRDCEQIAAALGAAAREGGRFDRRFRLGKPGHAGTWCRLTGSRRGSEETGWRLMGVLADLGELADSADRIERWHEAEQRFRQAFDATPQTAVQGYDRHRRVIYWNAASEALYGFRREQALGRLLEDLIIPAEAREAVIQAHHAWVNEGIEIPPAELMLLRSDGSQVPVFSSHVMLRNGWNEPEMYCIDVDLRPQRAALEQGSRRESQLRLVAQASHTACWECWLADGRIEWSQDAGAVLGMEAAALPADRAAMVDWVEPGQREALAQGLSDASGPAGVIEVELAIRRGRELRAYLLHGERHSDGQRLVGTLMDITASKSAAARIHQLANYDPVTGLPNRELLLDALQLAMDRCRQSQQRLVLACIGLDHFKWVNESYGTAAGDALLKACAQRVQESIRGSDEVVRLSGDEFLVLMSEVSADADVSVLAEKLLQDFRRPFVGGEREVFIAASLGLSVYPGDGETPETLVQHANTALHRAKDLGRANYQFFRAEMNQHAQDRLELTSRLRRAIEMQEFTLHYQPKIALADGRIVGGEALVRWDAPGLGSVSPERFIPLAEESGLIVPLGDWVLATAFATARAWRDAGHHGRVMAVNLSVRQFKSRDLVDHIAEHLRHFELPASAIELEITESVLLDPDGRSRDMLFALRELGFRIAIDDFGTGYSSLSYLRRFPIDVLKIDRSFVADCDVDASAGALVSAIVGLARSLHLGVVAEGVETAAQADFLRGLGCDHAQGWLFGRPVPASEFPEASFPVID